MTFLPVFEAINLAHIQFAKMLTLNLHQSILQESIHPEFGQFGPLCMLTIFLYEVVEVEEIARLKSENSMMGSTCTQRIALHLFPNK
jgi:hypothetical protein